jgi:hypothetical protein
VNPPLPNENTKSISPQCKRETAQTHTRPAAFYQNTPFTVHPSLSSQSLPTKPTAWPAGVPSAPRPQNFPRNFQMTRENRNFLRAQSSGARHARLRLVVSCLPRSHPYPSASFPRKPAPNPIPIQNLPLPQFPNPTYKSPPLASILHTH